MVYFASRPRNKIANLNTVRAFLLTLASVPFLVSCGKVGDCMLYEINKPDDADKTVACIASAFKNADKTDDYLKAKENLEFEARNSLKNAGEDKVVAVFDNYIALEDQLNNKFVGIDFAKLRATKFASKELEGLYQSKLMMTAGRNATIFIAIGNSFIDSPSRFIDDPNNSQKYRKVIRESAYAKYFSESTKRQVVERDQSETRLSLINQALKDKPFPVETVRDVISQIESASDDIQKVAQGYYGISEPIKHIKIGGGDSGPSGVDSDSVEYVLKLTLDDIQKKYSLMPNDLKSFESYLNKAKEGAKKYNQYYAIYKRYEDSVNNINALLEKNGLKPFDGDTLQWKVDNISRTLERRM